MGVGLILFCVEREGLQLEGESGEGVKVGLFDKIDLGGFVEADVGDNLFRFRFVFTLVIFTGCCNINVISTDIFASRTKL